MVRRGAKEKRKPRYDVAFYVPSLGPLLTLQRTPPTGGAETQIFLLARALARRGLAVCVIVWAMPGVAIPASVDGVDVSVRSQYRPHRRLGKLRESLAIARAIVAVDADVVVTRIAGPHVGIVGLVAKLMRRRFVYSSAHVTDFDFAQIEPKRQNREVYRHGIRLADSIVVQTSEQAQLCRERFGRPGVWIPSISEDAVPRDCEPAAFLWIARLVWYKRPLAYVELARSLPEARFWMVGANVPSSPEDDALTAQVAEAASDVSNLEWLEPRPRRELMDLVDRAVAIVNTADFEGMPNIFLEGWARGVPALALAHDPDGVIERYRLGEFARGSSERLVDLARELWETRHDRRELASRCRQYVLDHHSAEAVSARWQDALALSPATRR